MYGDIERVADKGTLLLRGGGGGGRVVQDGERLKVGAIGVLTAGRDAELFARCGDVRQGDPGGTVGGVGEVEGIAMALALVAKGGKEEGGCCGDVPRFPRIGSEGPDWGPRGDVVESHDGFLSVHSGGESCGLLSAVWLWRCSSVHGRGNCLSSRA